LEEFLEFIDKNFEPILFTVGQKDYVEEILKRVDKNGVFKQKLYQESCSIFKKLDEDLYEYVKDLSLFEKYRPLSRCILLDAKVFNFIINPDNCIPGVEYIADEEHSKDDFLLTVISDLETVIKLNDQKGVKYDVRKHLAKKFLLRETLARAKLK